MPHISFEVPPRPVKVKRELVKQVTKLVSELYEIPEASWMIHIHEVPTDSVSTGGVLISDKLK